MTTSPRAVIVQAMLMLPLGLSLMSQAADSADTARTSASLVAQFKSEPMFWRQFAIAQAIVERRDASVLPALAEAVP